MEFSFSSGHGYADPALTCTRNGCLARCPTLVTGELRLLPASKVAILPVISLLTSPGGNISPSVNEYK